MKAVPLLATATTVITATMTLKVAMATVVTITVVMITAIQNIISDIIPTTIERANLLLVTCQKEVIFLSLMRIKQLASFAVNAQRQLK
jgi:hypothetical protein